VKPVEEWAPVFARVLAQGKGYPWSERGTQTQFREGTYCRVCDCVIDEPGARHFKRHVGELERWRREQRRETERAGALRLEQVRRLTQEARR
jgi:hypothetical protein